MDSDLPPIRLPLVRPPVGTRFHFSWPDAQTAGWSGTWEIVRHEHDRPLITLWVRNRHGVEHGTQWWSDCVIENFYEDDPNGREI